MKNPQSKRKHQRGGLKENPGNERRGHDNPLPDYAAHGRVGSRSPSQMEHRKHSRGQR
jgi:hypothetical protein